VAQWEHSSDSSSREDTMGGKCACRRYVKASLEIQELGPRKQQAIEKMVQEDEWAEFAMTCGGGECQRGKECCD